MVSIAELEGKKIYLDANVFIYAMEQLDPWDKAAQAILRMVEQGRVNSVTSDLTLAECLIKPFRQNQPDNIVAFERALEPGDFFEVLPVSRPVLRRAAQLRAAAQVKLPDAVHAATAVLAGCDVVVTNDSGMLQMQVIPVALLSKIQM